MDRPPARLRRARSRTLAFGLLALLALDPRPVGAEWFVDVYGGPARPHDLQTELLSPGGPFHGATAATLDVERAFVGGGRVGYWLPVSARWAGLALDVASFRLDHAGLDVAVLPVSILAMARLPLDVSPEFPNGRMQPYIGAGPAAVYYSALRDGARADAPAASDASFGPLLAAGVTVLLRPDVGLFAEYRLSRAPGFEDPGDIPVGPIGPTQHVLVGLALRF
jgi:opacity protein-like surface antigen